MSKTQRMPTFFLSHGGGPCFWMEFPPPFGKHAFDKLRVYFSGLLARLPARPSAVLMVSAHWEEAVTTVTTAPKPDMIYDYYGFPENTYALKHPAPGNPALAAEVLALLKTAGIAAATDETRGFDHGVFVPMMMIDPKAELPITCLSLKKGLNAAAHIAIGRALGPLRDKGVLILGSGNSYHNLQKFFDGSKGDSDDFDAWLTQSVTAPDAATRNATLEKWESAPAARSCHPREEHLLPLMVISGAAGDDIGVLDYQDRLGEKAISGYLFGETL